MGLLSFRLLLFHHELKAVGQGTALTVALYTVAASAVIAAFGMRARAGGFCTADFLSLGHGYNLPQSISFIYYNIREG